MPDMTPVGVTLARAACSTLSDAQRVAFAIELARDVTDEHCVLPLTRLAAMAWETADQLRKSRFERECA